MTINLKIST